MKLRTTTMIALAFIGLFIVSCTSKEEKAAKLIRNELSKTLYDFDSYNPIETKVKEAKSTAFNDSTCWNKANVLAYGLNDMVEKVHAVTNAAEHMAIWGRPSYYSSSYSDSQYYKYKRELDEAVSEANLAIIICNKLAKELSVLINKLDTSQVVGWEVTHDFRCKTKGGSSEIGHYRYVINKKFDAVILCEDVEGKRDEDARAVIEKVMNGWDELSTIDI